MQRNLLYSKRTKSNRSKAIHTISRSLHLLLSSHRRCPLLLHPTIRLLSRHDQDLKCINPTLKIGILLHKELIPLLQMRNVFRRFRQYRRLVQLVRRRQTLRSSSISWPREFFLLMTRRLGTESRSAAILSLRFVRYRFSIMLCAVFLTGCPLRVVGGGLSSSSSSSTLDLRLRLFSHGSGEEAEELGDVGYWDDCCCWA